MQKAIVAHADTPVTSALDKMLETGHHMLPVVDEENRVVGLFSTLSVIGHLVPDYIVSGDLDDIPYAPDFGLLRNHYDAMKDLKVSQLMVDAPFAIKPEESLLSVAAALVTHAMHDCVLVIDSDRRLVGMITSSDVLDQLRNMPEDGSHAG